MSRLLSKPIERHTILSQISEALSDVQEKNPLLDVQGTWSYGGSAKQLNTEELITLFVERCKDYKAMVVRLSSEEELPAALAETVKALELQSLVVPPGLESAWLSTIENSDLSILRDDPPLDKTVLDTVDGVITSCAGAIAETGTITLDHSANQGRRVITLLPMSHICVVQSAVISAGVPEAIQRLKPGLSAGRPATWISGPSATVDIEFTRVEGVHGPHKLFVLVVG